MRLLDGEVERLCMFTRRVEPDRRDRSWAWSIGVECFVPRSGRVWREPLSAPVTKMHVCFFLKEATDGLPDVQGAVVARQTRQLLTPRPGITQIGCVPKRAIPGKPAKKYKTAGVLVVGQSRASAGSGQRVQ